MDELIREGDLAIRQMRDDPADYELFVRWRNEPHVAEWWTTDDDPTPTTFDRVVAEYGPRAEDASWATGCIINVGDRPIGYTHFYPWSAEADEAREMGIPDIDGSFGLDIFIGEPDMIDRGVGSRTVALLARHLFDQRDATGVALLTPVGNERAHRCVREGRVPEAEADARLRRRERRAADELADGSRTTSGMMQGP